MIKLVVTTMVAMVFCCAGWATAEDPSAVGIRLAFEPDSLDWTLGDVPIHVINNSVEGLFAVDPAGKLVASEAAALPQAKAGATGVWRIRLRPELRWSDGVPVRAGDYVAAWTRLLDPKTASTYAYLLYELAGARDFNRGATATWVSPPRAVSDTELEVRLAPGRRAFPTSALTHWATFPVRADLIAAHPGGWGSRPEQMAFNGPYRISSYEHEARITLVPNERHRHPGRLKRIDALIVGDDSTALRLYESGRLAFVPELNTLERAQLARRPDYHSMRSPILTYLGIDVNDPLLKSAELRRALSFAIDRALFPQLLAMNCLPVSGLEASPRPDNGVDRDTARKLGAALSGRRLEFGYYEKGLNRLVVEFLQAQWKTGLGLETSLETNEVKSYWKRLARKPYPLFLNSYAPPVWDAAYTFRLLTAGNPMNMGRWSNTDYERALDKGDLKAAAAILKAEAPIIPLYYRSYDYLLSPRLKGAVLNVMSSLDLRDAELVP